MFDSVAITNIPVADAHQSIQLCSAPIDARSVVIPGSAIHGPNVAIHIVMTKPALVMDIAMPTAGGMILELAMSSPPLLGIEPPRKPQTIAMPRTHIMVASIVAHIMSPV